MFAGCYESAVAIALIGTIGTILFRVAQLRCADALIGRTKEHILLATVFITVVFALRAAITLVLDIDAVSILASELVGLALAAIHFI